MATPPGFRLPKQEPFPDRVLVSSADPLQGLSGSIAGVALATKGAGDTGRQGGSFVTSEENARNVDSGGSLMKRGKDARVPEPVEDPQETSPEMISKQDESLKASAGELAGEDCTDSDRGGYTMDPCTPFFNAHMNQWYNSQPLPQYYSHPPVQPSHYLFHPFSLQHPLYPPHPPTPLNLQSFNRQSQLPSHQPFQPSNFNATTTQHRERNPNWTKEEDETLCKAWLHVAEDAAKFKFTNQSRGKLWERILAEFNDLLDRPTIRISSGLMNRWSTIQAAIIKYSCCVEMIKRSTPSASNHEDTMEAINRLYYESQGHHFKLNGCWLILKDSKKWCDYLKGQEKNKKHQPRKKGGSGMDVEETPNNSNPYTPVTILGSATPASVTHDDTKDQEEEKMCHQPRKRGGSDVDVEETPNSSNPSTPVATLGSATPDSVNLDGDDSPPYNEPMMPPELVCPHGQNAAKRSRSKKSKKHRGIAKDFADLIAGGFSDLTKEQNAIDNKELNIAYEHKRMRLEIERMRLEAARLRVAAKERRQQQRLEMEIMMADPNSIGTEEGKTWLIAQQREILAHMRLKGIGDGSSGSSH